MVDISIEYDKKLYYPGDTVIINDLSERQLSMIFSGFSEISNLKIDR